MYRVTISPDRILPFHGTNWQRLSDMLHSIKRGWKPEPIYAFPLARYVEKCLFGMLDGHHRRVLSKIRGLSVETIVIETAEEMNRILSYNFDERSFKEMTSRRTEKIDSEYEEIGKQTNRWIDHFIKNSSS